MSIYLEGSKAGSNLIGMGALIPGMRVVAACCFVCVCVCVCVCVWCRCA